MLPACLTEICIGPIYCFSMFQIPLTSLSGVVASSPDDFTTSEIMPAFSCAAIGLGVGGAFLGRWVDKVGPVRAGTVGSLFWFGSLVTSAVASHLHSLPLLYLGYGGLGGVAWGLLYMTPVSATMKWFPDRRGLATGLTLSAFGAGAAIAPPLIEHLTSLFFIAPDFLGPLAEISLTTLPDGGQCLSSDESVKVIVATAQDAAKFGLNEGVYKLGTGDSGAAGAFASLATIYGGLALLSSQFMSAPPPGWLPKGYVVDEEKSTMGTTVGVPARIAVQTPQFPLLWATVFGNAIGGLALISSSKLIMTDIWSNASPELVTASFCTGYVSALGSANSFGRLSYAIASDSLGRKNTYTLFGFGLPVMVSTPYLISNAGPDAGIIPLCMFLGGSTFVIANYGGVFSILPAYIADLFGSKYSNSIHGAALTAWSASAVAGPLGLAHLRSRAERAAIEDLVEALPAGKLEATFGTTDLESLIESKTLTISRLMDLAPPGIADPTCHLYDDVFYVGGGFIFLAAVCNQLLRPPNVQKLLRDDDKKAVFLNNVTKIK